MATELAKAYVQIVPSAQGLTGSLTSLMSGEGTAAGEEAGRRAGTSFGSVLKKTIVGLGIGKLLMESIGNTSEFETGMAKVNTLFAGTKEEFAQLQSDILNLSSAYGISTAELTEAAYSAESAGVSQQNLMSMMESSARLAQAGFTDLDTALSATAKTMNAYGDAAGSIEDVQRVLMQTQNLGITTVGELGQSLANVTPTAAAMGVSFDQVGASMAQLTAAGVPTAQATTQLRAAMTELGKAGTKADKAFRAAAKDTKYAGMSFQEAMASGANLGEVFGMMQTYADASGQSMVDLWGSVEAGNAAMLIASDVETFNRNLSEMNTTADVVGEAYETMADTFGTSMNKLKESAKNFVATLFQGGDISASFDALLTGLGDVGKKLIGWFKNGLTALGQNLPQMMASLIDFGVGLLEALAEVDWIEVGTTLITGIIGALGTLGTKLAELISDAVTSIVNGDVDWASLGVAILGGFGSIVTSIGQVATDIWNAFSEVLCPNGENVFAGIFSDGEKKIAEIDWVALGENVASAGASLVNMTGEVLAGGFTAAENIIKTINWENLGTTVGKVANGLVNLTGEVLTAGFTAAESIINTIDWEALGETVGQVGNNIIALTGEVLSAGFTAAESLINSIDWAGLGETVGSVANGLINLTGETLSGAFTAAESAINAIDWEGLGTTVGSVANELINLSGETLSGAFTAAHAAIKALDWNGIGTTLGSVANSLITNSAEILAAPFKGAHDLLMSIDWAGAGQAIQSGLGDVWDSITGLAGNTLDAAGNIIGGAGNVAGAGLNWLADLISGGSDLQQSAEEIKKAMAEMKKAVDKGKEDLKTSAKEVGSGIVTSIRDEVSPLKMNPLGNAVITGIADGITQKLVELAQKVELVKTAIKTSFAGTSDTWTPAGKSIVDGIATGIENNSSTITSKIETILTNAAGVSLGTKWENIGLNIITGIIQGINKYEFMLKLRIDALANTINQLLKDKLKIGSPSKVMQESIGRWIPAGIAEGIDEYSYMVNDALSGMAGDMTSSQMRSSLMDQNSGIFSGRLGAGSGATSEETNDVQIALLQEQNSLLRRILNKDTTIQFGPSVDFGRTAKRSMELLGMVGG